MTPSGPTHIDLTPAGRTRHQLESQKGRGFPGGARGAVVQIFSLGADRFGEYYRNDIARWRGIVKQAGISIE